MISIFGPSTPQGDTTQVSTKFDYGSLMIMAAIALPFFSAMGLGNQPMKFANQFKRIVLCTIAFLSFIRVADAAVDVLGVMAAELDRSIEVLSEESPPLYFLSYEITQQDRASVVASFGAVSQNSRSEDRVLDIDLRVGDKDLDNTHPTGRGFDFRVRSRTQVPVSDPEALRTVLWLATDRKYRQATERLSRVEASVRIKVDEENRAADFSPQQAVEFRETPRSITTDASGWAEKLKRYSAPFAEADHIYAGSVSFSTVAETRWYVNSEGTSIRTSRTSYRLGVFGSTKAEDGMNLPRYEQFFAFNDDGMPDEETVMETVRQVIADLQALRIAPVAEPYSGPAILSGRASGVFFHEILGHRVEGHRQREADDAQTFKDMTGESVLPESFSVVFDPTIRHAGGTDLAGSFRFDNEGVNGQRVVVIDQGLLQGFLMSRKPIEGFSGSNGHGRKQPGFAAVARQSNLFVEVEKPLSESELKTMLLKRLRDEGKEYGLLFDAIQGGFTFTGRRRPNSFNVLPTMVYRIYLDGREELVRGVDLIGTPLTTFSKIEAGGKESATFNGVCGAESGGVPVSAISPPILVSQIEVQRKEKSQQRPPILPAPSGLAQSGHLFALGGLQ